MKSTSVLRLLCLLAGWLGPWLALAQAESVPAVDPPAVVLDDQLVLGRISDDPRHHHDQLRALLDYVVPRMADVGVREGRVLMAHDTQQMASYLRRGRVDWVTETAATGLLLAERGGGEVLVATERNGVALYHSVIFVRRDSGIRSLTDLRGRSIAFQNPNSTSAYFMPAADLLGQSLSLEILLSPRDRPRDEGVGYVFAQSESNITTWVHKRLVDAGAFSHLDWQGLERMPPSFRDDLLVIHHTADFPRGIELVRGGMPAARKARLREILLQAAADPAAAAPLKRFFGTNGFVPIEGEMAEALQRTEAAALKVKAALE